MIPETMVQPSYWVEKGINIELVQNLYLFKFAPDLQDRLDSVTYSYTESKITL